MAFNNATIYNARYGAVPADFKQLASGSFAPGLQVAELQAGGQVNRKTQSTLTQGPTGAFSTHAIWTALGICSLDGVQISVTDPLVLQATAYDPYGTRATGANNITITATDGMLTPNQVTATQAGYAAIDYNIFLVSQDGVTQPFQTSDTATIAGDDTADEQFTLGPVVIDSTAYDGLQNLTLDFGLDVSVQGGDGDIYPKFVFIRTRKPSVTFEFIPNDSLFDFGDQGLAFTTLDFYLSKAEKNGRISSGSDHIKFTATEGFAIVNSAAWQSAGDQAISVNVPLTDDGTNAILQIAQSALP
jgi:hypothetical protein